jgi:hypothetical protein
MQMLLTGALISSNKHDGRVYIEIHKGVYGLPPAGILANEVLQCEDAENLMAAIKKNYDISSDWTGSAYCGLKIDWDYTNGTVDLSMPRYINAALHKFRHPTPTRPENAPDTWNPPVYGATTPYIEDTQDSPALSQKEVTHLQQLGGTLLYYARAVDPTLIMPVNVLDSEQTKATASTADKIIKLLNYCIMHPEATLCYHA